MLLAVRRLDDTIAQIRSPIFAITAPDHGHRTARIRFMELAAEASAGLPRPVDVHFGGPVDLLVEGRLLEESTAVVRELLMNAVRHASAMPALALDLSRRAGVAISVYDDGCGIPATGRRSGLRNLRPRRGARRRDGDRVGRGRHDGTVAGAARRHSATMRTVRG